MIAKNSSIETAQQINTTFTTAIGVHCTVLEKKCGVQMKSQL